MKGETHQRIIVSFDLDKVAGPVNAIHPVPIDMLGKGFSITFDFCLHCLEKVENPHIHHSPICVAMPGAVGDLKPLHGMVRDSLLPRKIETYLWMGKEEIEQ